MAGNVLIKNANGNTVTLQNPDTNVADVVVDTSAIIQRNKEKDISYKSTPISITSWSYVGTTITLNVASHSFVAGDYIEVAGLTATTYPANGIQLITSVTATTIVFTLGATPTGTAGVSSATVKGFITVNGKLPVLISAGINTSFTANGYEKLPSGIIIQWGSVTTPAGGTQAVTFPITFPNVAFQAIGHIAGGSVNYTVSQSGLTTTGVSFITYVAPTSAATASTVRWLAVGY